MTLLVALSRRPSQPSSCLSWLEGRISGEADDKKKFHLAIWEI